MDFPEKPKCFSEPVGAFSPGHYRQNGAVEALLLAFCKP
jgi:hypothetical protein